MQTVLVIDDDAALRDTIGLMLEMEGFRPVLTSDGRYDDDATLSEIKLLASVLQDRTTANAIGAAIVARNMLSLK